MQSAIQYFIEHHPPIVPVVSLNSVSTAIHLADALVSGGVNAMEITLRTAAGFEAIKQIKLQRPEMFLCVGSITNTIQMSAAIDAGASIVVTPGINRKLIQQAQEAGVSILPGISTATDILLGLEYNLSIFKFFPAEALGGLHYLNAIAQPFPQCRFCPTGGLTAKKTLEYLKFSEVAFIAGSFLSSPALIESNDWTEITKRCLNTLQDISSYNENDKEQDC